MDPKEFLLIKQIKIETFSSDTYRSVFRNKIYELLIENKDCEG